MTKTPERERSRGLLGFKNTTFSRLEWSWQPWKAFDTKYGEGSGWTSDGGYSSGVLNGNTTSIKTLWASQAGSVHVGTHILLFKIGTKITTRLEHLCGNFRCQES